MDVRNCLTSRMSAYKAETLTIEPRLRTLRPSFRLMPNLGAGPRESATSKVNATSKRFPARISTTEKGGKIV